MDFCYRKHPISRPVYRGAVLGFADRQRILPRGWCPICGGEIFARGKGKCKRCQKEEKTNVRKKLQSLC